MYIDTRTKKSMENFICEYFNVTIKELERLFFNIYNSNYDAIDLMLKDLVSNREIVLNEVLFFHFSRRLKGEEDNYRGDNLYNLLLNDTPVSNFLKENGIVFQKGEKHLELIHRGKIETFDHVYEGNVSNVKWRMGYFEGREDYCFNGFALKDLLYKNSYARELYWGPEFINQMLQVIGREDVLEKYMENSIYYCLEYKIPIERVIIDEYDDALSVKEKCEHLVLAVLRRLYQYYTTNTAYMYDDDNMCLRLKDNDTMESNYLVSKEELTRDMLI